MISVQTILKITDNSGAIQAMCIKLPIKQTKAKIGDVITTVIKKSIIKKGVKKSKEIKKGQISIGLIIRTKIGAKR
jgi:ribosomal protein L14